MFGFQPVPIESDPSGVDPPGGCAILSQSSYAGTGTSHSITLPGGIVAGDKIAIAVAYRDYAAPPSGFGSYTLLRTQYLNGDSSKGALRTYTKVADGSEGSSIASTTSSSTQVCAIAYRLTCPHEESGSSSGGFSDTATSAAPSPTVSIDVMQMLSLAFIDGRKLETFPSGYMGYYDSIAPGHTASSLVLSVGWKTDLSASETPGDISIDDDVYWATAVEVFG
ncbi:MAG: hypothetical protein IT422_05160 [Pirellulaceae bacterium]|nr:hypothetical protein [Pirellulaceae bacterium]